MSTKLAVVGPRGRLGERICALAKTEKSLEVVAGLVRKVQHEDTNTDFPLTQDIREALKEAQVVIDVSAPAACMHILPACIENDVPYVCGSTGLNVTELESIKLASAKIPILLASNFSIGVNVLLNLVAQAGRLLGEDFDTEIFEIHHGKKRDAPSGTALSLGNVLKEAKPGLVDVFARSGQNDERSATELGYAALRGGDVAGEHTVFFLGEAERLELTHRATSRDIFARGALRAAGFLAGQKAGFYTMQDVLGLKG